LNNVHVFKLIIALKFLAAPISFASALSPIQNFGLMERLSNAQESLVEVRRNGNPNDK